MAYHIGNIAVDPKTEDGQDLLGKVHQDRSRVTCSCTSPAPAMYVSCVNGRFILKRKIGRASCRERVSPYV